MGPAASLAVPLLDRVRRVGEHHVEGLQTIAFEERRVRERVAGSDVEVLHAVQHEVHAGDCRRDADQLLTEEADRPVVPAAALHIGERRDQHSPGTAGRVVDQFAGVRFEHLGHQMDDGAVRVELLRRVPAVVGELLDEVLVAVAELVFRDERERQVCFEKCSIRFLSVSSGICALSVHGALPKTPSRRSGLACSIARNAVEQRAADVLRDVSHVRPVRTVRDLEAVVGESRWRSRRHRCRRAPEHVPHPIRPRGA